jgi:4-aminobutyrate aminotransferase-like enzyme
MFQAIETDGMLENAAQRGAQLMKGLVKLAAK